MRIGLVLGCLIVPLIVIFGPILYRDRQFAFQDAGHYYYPLLERVQQEWDAGRWPLWAPGGRRGDPAPGQPDGRGALPRQARLLPVPAPLGGAVLRDRPCRARLRGDGGDAPGLGCLRHGVDPRLALVWLRRARAEPGEQRHLPGGSGVGAPRFPRGRSLGPPPGTWRVAGAGRRAGDASPRRGPGGGLPDRRRRDGVCRRPRLGQAALGRGPIPPRLVDDLGPGLSRAARPLVVVEPRDPSGLGRDAGDARPLVAPLGTPGRAGVGGLRGGGRRAGASNGRREGFREDCGRPGRRVEPGPGDRRRPIVARPRIHGDELPRGRIGRIPRLLSLQRPPPAIARRRLAETSSGRSKGAIGPG